MIRHGSPALALLVLALPFAAFVLIGLVRPLRRAGRSAAIVSIATMAAALGSAFALWVTAGPATARFPSATWPWLPGDGGPMATVGVMVDSLSMTMCVLVTLVSFLVQLYSFAYLHDEPAPALGRYYAYQSLFAFSMLGLVLAPGFLQMFVFWELVGLCSYLLIGFWYARPSAARAAVKAFWITKLGDLGFTAGIVMLWAHTGTFDFGELFRLADTGALRVLPMGTIMFLVYLGAVGKSAQFPLHVWLPDAMEGPTPVSALIHAATMVTAGVYMVTRAFPLFVLVPDLLTLIAWVGAFTALLAATMACVESDIKRVLAYSTVSQLGFMMAAAGAAAPAAAFAHLVTHGVFKALLFLGAGVVIHVFHTNDVWRMGGLFGRLPWVGLPFVAGTLALAGVWPLPGFFSKEGILAAVLDARLTVPFAMLVLGTFLTAFYMFRVVFLVFFGRPVMPAPHSPDREPAEAPGHAAARAGYADTRAYGDAGARAPAPTVAASRAQANAPLPSGQAGHAAGVPLLMDAVCIALGALTVALGLKMAFFTEHGEPQVPGWLPALSLGLAVAGVALAWLVYQRGALDPARLSALFGPIDFMARRRYGLDALYAGLYRGVLLALSRLVGWVDRYLVDGLLNVFSAWTLRTGDAVRRVQSGRAQDYVYGVAFGVLVLFVWAQWWSRP